MSPYTRSSSRNRVSAVLRIPSCLLPSDSSSLAWPWSSACTHSINGIVRKQRGLYILTWMDAWGSFHFGWQGYSVCACLFPGFTRVLCKQQLSFTDWSWRIVFDFFFWSCNRMFVQKCVSCFIHRHTMLLYNWSMILRSAAAILWPLFATVAVLIDMTWHLLDPVRMSCNNVG